MNIYEGTFELWAKNVENEFRERLQQAYNLGYEDGMKAVVDKATAIMEVKADLGFK